MSYTYALKYTCHRIGMGIHYLLFGCTFAIKQIVGKFKKMSMATFITSLEPEVSK